MGRTILGLCLFFVEIVVVFNTTVVADEAYMNQFAVHLRNPRNADLVAKKHGLTNLGPIGSLDGYYLFEHPRVSKRSVQPSHEHHEILNNDPEVKWVQQQKELKRVKRDLFQSFHNFQTVPMMRSMPSASFSDPLYGDQWYLHGGAAGGFDMNVVAAWQKGYSGKNVVVSILDDGLQSNHPDLIDNYDPFASTDINGNDEDPMPQDNGDNKHGTRCAGEVAAMASNGICGVGVAFNASIGGVRMLDGTVNDAVEARALSHNPHHIDIYSASWGPEDDGKTVDGPGPLAMQAFIDGVRKGRRGKGSIFVWASGNGGRHLDNCNCDGYTNSIYTLSISSATQHGLKPWYLEECSSTLATTYSSGDPGHDRSVVTVDMDTSFSSQRMCTKEHTGTSASAPIAAAICALALEANRELTWRDFQYLVVLSSKPDPLLKEDGWIVNGVGRKVSHKFGYGVMDAGAIVTLAERWPTVPPQRICDLPPDSMERIIPNEPGSSAEFYLDTDGCFGSMKQVNFLEHVQARISLNFSPRGNLRIILTSPFGTRSTLLFPRPRDVFKSTFDEWPFLSVHFWGERPAGRWRLSIMNAGNKPSHQAGILKRWSLVFYGTEVDAVRKPAMESPDFMPFASASSPTLSSVSLNGNNGSRVDIVKSVDRMLDHSKCDVECDGGCLGEGADRCKACRHLSLETQSGRTCVAECPDGWYATPALKCLRCHPSCASCTGEYSTDCVSCPSDLWLLKTRDRTQCVPDCPVGFLRSDGRECNPCGSKCTSCYLNPDQCIECHPGLIAFNGKCVPNCPAGTYAGKEKIQCLFCHPTCERCDSSQCYECRKGYTLDVKSGACQPANEADCSQGFYRAAATCRQCHVSCAACYGPAYSQCKLCSSSKFLLKGVCVDKCPKGYAGKRGGPCTACHETCATCSGSEENQCLSCRRAATTLENGECRAACPNGSFFTEGKCEKCHSSCATCKGPGGEDCLSCRGDATLSSANACESAVCPVKYFLAASQCLPCHESCQTCKGASVFECTTCADNRVRDGRLCTTCPYGQFFDPLSQTCLRCNSNCTTCDGPDAFSCLSCKDNLRLDAVLRRCVPCCAQLAAENCCDCSIHSNLCVSNPTTDKRRITDDDSVVMAQFGSTEQMQHSDVANIPSSLLMVVAGSCFAVVLLFFVIFGILQMRSSNSPCCNRDGYQRVPILPWTSTQAEKEKLIQEECEDIVSLHATT